MANVGLRVVARTRDALSLGMRARGAYAPFCDDPCEFHLCSESYDTCMSDMLASDVPEDVGFCGMSDTADMNWKEINVYLFSTKQCQTCKMCHKKQCLRTFAMSDV